MPNRPARQEDRGQVTVFFAFGILFLVLATGLAIDAGICYVAKAKLSTSVDGACLAGMKTLAQGQTTATTVAQDIFYANYGANPPTPSITFPTNGTGNQQVQVSATTNVRTLFMQVVPGFKTVAVSDTAVSTRGSLVMTIILDRSGSMCGGTVTCIGGGSGDDGGEALQVAVPDFIDDFENNVDHIALVSFASSSSTDVALTTNFQTAVTQAVGGYTFVGGTFGGGAGTNSCTGSCQTTYGPPLNMADYQNNTVSLSQEIKVVVYFTDGQMNAIQDSLACTNLGNTLYNYGGYDPPSTDYAFFSATNSDSDFQHSTGNDLSWWYSGSTVNKNGGCTVSGGSGGGVGLCGTNPPWSSTARCQGVTQFYSQLTGSNQSFNWTSITNETKYRAITTANNMRSESIPTYIFVIGLGNVITGTTGTEQFLSTLANDPSGPTNYGCGTGTYNASNTGNCYNPDLPAGLFLIVPDCPSSTCTQELTTAFQTIAAKVLLRLTE